MGTGDKTEKDILVDCDRGRALGCKSFCCRLIVRLAPGERDPSFPDNREKSCVDKHQKTGLCLQFDEETSLCACWNARPLACRTYNCSQDSRLRVVLEEGFSSLVQLATSDALRKKCR